MASVERTDLIVADGDAWQAWLGEPHQRSEGGVAGAGQEERD
jgi:hypothetical protein